jgi:large subunit ribosomal protein L5
MSELFQRYKQLIPELMERLGYDNFLALPRFEKVVVSMGLGKAVENRAILDVATKDLAMITGQKPLVTKARRSVATFKVRKGQEIGLKVTLRRERMYEFLDRLINIAIPRIRDFRGFPLSAFDEAGNYSLGIAEHTIFPEVDISRTPYTLGMNVTICIKARRKEDAVELLKSLGFPFRSR